MQSAGVCAAVCPAAGGGLRSRGVRSTQIQRKTCSLLQLDSGCAAGTQAYAEADRLRMRPGAVEGGRRHVLQLRNRLPDLHGVSLEKHRTPHETQTFRVPLGPDEISNKRLTRTPSQQETDAAGRRSVKSELTALT